MTLVMPTRILVVGGGGREHALAWKLGREPGVERGAGRARERRDRRASRTSGSRGVDPLDPAAVVALAREHASELVVVGPEAPLAAGVADALRAAGIAVFGPDRRGRPARDVEGVLPRGRRRRRASGWRGRGRSRAGEAAEARGVRPRARRGRRAAPSSRPTASPAGKGVIVTDVGRAGDRARAVLPRGPPGGRARPRHRGAARRVARRASSRSATGRGPSPCPAARDHKRLCDGDRGPEHRRHGRVLAAARPRRRRRRARCSRRSTGRSSPRWPAAAPRSAASSTPA